VTYTKRFAPDISIDGSRGHAAGRQVVGAIVNTPYCVYITGEFVY